MAKESTIVDMRTRPPLETWVTKAQFRQGGVYYPTRVGFSRPPSAEQRSVDLLVSELDAAGVRWAVIMGRQSVEPTGSIPNDEIAACVAKYPDRFLAWAGIDITRPMDWCLAEIDRCAKLPGFKGVSIEPAIARGERSFWAYDPRFYPIYEECLKLDLPINITLSAVLQMNPGRGYEYASPLQIYRVAKDFPKLDIHIAHAGWPAVMDMIGVAFVCPNVWLSPDQYFIKQIPQAQEYWKAANYYMQERTLFSSNYPSRPHSEMIKACAEWPWDAGVLPKIMGRNALRLMRMS
jgi:predicted TIM-barrel fold metal-dependent hydrolase